MRKIASPLINLGIQGLGLLLAGCGGGGGGGQTMPPPVIDTTAPTIPAGVTATAQAATQILVSWTVSTDAGTGVAGYHVYRDGGATALATVTATSYTDNSVLPSTLYSYTVRAFDGATPPNESVASAAASATTPAATPVFAVQRVFPNLANFSVPIALLQEPNRTDRWYLAQKSGAVRVFDNQANVSTTRTFIDIVGRLNFDPNNPNDERGLLGMAFHPDFPTNPRVYLYYTASDNTLGLVDRVAEFRTLDGGTTLDPSTELVLFNIDDPETNHNGGNIAFGPDGFLYIGIGDGGGGGDAHGNIGNGQLLTTLLGKMLRIDVSAATQAQTYAIPPLNPYAANPRCNVNGNSGTAANCPEIFAYGFRNPWRWSFDRGSGELWLNDVGQSTLEEVDKVTLGGNYGWRCFEGANAFNNTCGPNSASAIAPVAQYGRTLGFSTTGGFVYRGSAIPGLFGRYVFGDFGSGNIWQIPRDTMPTMTMGPGLASGLQISTFAQDADGEVYVVHFGGTIHKLVPVP